MAFSNKATGAHHTSDEGRPANIAAAFNALWTAVGLRYNHQRP